MRRLTFILAAVLVAACYGAPGSSPSSGGADMSNAAGASASPGLDTLSPSADAAQTGAPTVAPTLIPSPSPRPSMAARPDIRPGDLAMTVADALWIRSRPDVSSSSRTYRLLRWGTRLAVEVGPVAGSGYWWCRVRVLGDRLEGWVAVAAKDGTRWIVAGETAILVALQERIVGSWTGTVTTKWVAPYRVSIVFRANGTYSSRAAVNSAQYPALYWGTDADSPMKTYAIRDVAADGTASGDIVLYFGSGSTVLDRLDGISVQGARLRFSVTHLGQYGPITFDLTRTKG